jgi:hypothetical protein
MRKINKEENKEKERKDRKRGKWRTFHKLAYHQSKEKNIKKTKER